ncbi:precorrin-2 dehydrogenase/sirohydrochlorin ferrochelatase family protein [Enterococcus raffinosus]|uniref:precorrin-2 dehydrogenase n=1 Tax=Enterococcus raffinosus TaxID=71452 RepID=A0AAW8TDR4_9ENTE|nr:bifunctional precorrin-2 dehydrogenase/sirohydrochlorin ferrochelatase [Enterococcus raffinosus]MDT2523903.1 bifunctional precorrin-2 dehydrogenase/sirohydrochlorin ferrochelatase [Enterococcus raffinosus]MDT2528822.1 bifunctional precorrin-2 dehydrogenase/sirohydrochlorin ferrochelatase [Enterococcus raffinosus]MDT2534734.1 bifunctional precorrin-2 dehydrogenase/sirohydrochlorin ferrochelatase [Enterococcus raffinosus]MDT2545939.1 bifunctional precorrin-2 dehydrogenase/sirohydrochlorin ferr
MYPILIDISQFSVLVVGGGKIATRKVCGLIEAGAKPTVISPKFSDRLLTEKKNGTVVLRERSFQYGDTNGFQVVFICTDNKAVNQAILNETTPRQLVNDTTNQSNSNFFNMALIKEKDFGIALTTKGNNPGKTKALKQKLQSLLKGSSLD